MAVILRYFSEFVYLPEVLSLRKGSRSLSHLLMSSCVVHVDTVCLFKARLDKFLDAPRCYI